MAGTLPIQATSVAAQWDSLYGFLVGLSIFFFVLVVGGMIVFAYKYRKSAVQKTTYFTDSHALEGLFIAIPTILLMVIFGWGYKVYHSMVNAPSDAYEVRVIGKQWLWTFLYDHGKSTVGELYVPINRPVKLTMTSDDVIHSFFVPNFRIKQDVVPGMYTSVWFETSVPGRHQVYCTEYCGTSHSGMLAQVIALTDEQWAAWLRGKDVGPIPKAGEEGVASGSVTTRTAAPVTLTLAEQGKKVFETKGCVACHSVDGTAKVGPTLKGLVGTQVTLNDGSTVQADDNYLKESIENPASRIVKGFAPSMPTFKGLISETETAALIAYIKSLK